MLKSMKKLIECTELIYVRNYKEVIKCNVVSLERDRREEEYFNIRLKGAEVDKVVQVKNNMSVGYFGNDFIAADTYTAKSALDQARDRTAEKKRAATIRLSNIRLAERAILTI